MAYLDATINHLRAVHEWAHDNGAQIHLDLLNFELEVKGRNRYFILYPQFVSESNGQRAHTSVLTRSVVGFIGWLPYRPIRWPMSNDKLLFKKRIAELGMNTPMMWPAASAATADYLLKAAAGSFGNDISGPYHRGSMAGLAERTVPARPGKDTPIYAEQFIPGRNLKAWFWGADLFHLELDAYPEIVGDGQNTVAGLLQQRLSLIAADMGSYGEMVMVELSLAYQGLTLSTVLASGQTAWLDFRYGRRFMPEKNNRDTNRLPDTDSSTLDQIREAGHLLARELMQHWNAPVLYSLDGVLDAQGRIWWLEMNSNPIFAPSGYRIMLATLFGTPVMPGPQERVAGTVADSESEQTASGSAIEKILPEAA